VDDADIAGTAFSAAIATCLPNSTPSSGRRAGAPSEVLPDKTFIAEGSDSFLNNATDFHKQWGLRPVRVRTAYDLLKRLGAGTATNKRIRLVSHASKDGLFLPVFSQRKDGSRLDKGWLTAISGGAITVYERLLGAPITERDTKKAIASILEELDHNADFFRALHLENPSDEVKRFLLAIFVVGTGQSGNVDFAGSGASDSNRRLYRRGASAWLDASQAALGNAVPTNTLDALMRAVTEVSRRATWTEKVDLTKQWSADITGALRLGGRLDVDLAACRAACDITTFFDVRGCQLDKDTLTAFSGVLGVPGRNVSGSHQFTAYPKTPINLVSVFCENTGTFAARDDVRKAVQDLAELVKATRLPRLTREGAVHPTPWEDLEPSDQLPVMLEVWESIPVVGVEAGPQGEVPNVGSEVILNAHSSCREVPAGPLNLFLRSLWADAPQNKVDKIRRQVQKTKTVLVPVLASSKEKTAVITLPFLPSWDRKIITG
jgi:hypothetical protein